MDQYIGKLLDNRYEILELVGTGGMAKVYKARCHRLLEIALSRGAPDNVTVVLVKR